MFESAAAVAPEGLGELAPGPMLADFVSVTDTGDLSGHDRVLVLVACQRLVSHYQAEVYRHMAALPDAYGDLSDDPEVVFDAAATEIRCALQLTRRAADTELGVAVELAERLPAIWELLGSGRIDPRRARAILYHTTHLETETARAVVAAILEDAPRWTTGQIAARIRRLAIELDPESAKERHERAVEQRRMVLEPTPDGTADLHLLDLSPDRAQAALNHIDTLAKELRGAGETRTIDQLRADVALDLLTGTSTSVKGSSRGVIELRTDLTTLAELNDHPADLGGYGPVIADIARRVADQAPDTEWRYTITQNGQPIGGGTTRRRPTASQRREVTTRYPTCVFPGCRMPATACDLDHITPHTQGGATHPQGLGPNCRHDHHIRHQAGWTYIRLPNGNHQWTSPLNHTYTTSRLPP